MGFPRIIYGTNSDRIVDFTDYLREGSGYFTNENIVSNQALSGIEYERHFFSQGIVNLRFRYITPDVKAQLDAFKEYAKDGSTFTVELDRDLGGFWGFEGNSLKNNDQVNGTFTRGEATDNSPYLRRYDGLYVLPGQGLPRYPAGKFGDGIFVENLYPNAIGAYHSDFSGWTATACTVNVNTTETKDPLGANNADKLTFTTGGSVFFDTATTISTSDGVFSVFLKSPSGDATMNLRLYDDTGTELNTEVITVVPDGSDGNGFTRFKVAYDNPGSNANHWRCVIQAQGNNTVYAYGGHMEHGKLYMGSFNVEGYDEKLLYSSTNLIQKNKGTIAMWIYPLWVYNQHVAAMLMMCADDDTAATRHLHIEVNAGGNLRLLIMKNNDGTTAIDLQASASALTQNDWNYVVVTWDATISNGAKLYINGVQVGSTSSNDPFNISEIGTYVSIGSSVGGAFESDCIIDEVVIYKSVLNATQIKNLYNSSGLNFGRNRITCRLVDKNFPINYLNGGIYDCIIQAKEVLT